jgi:hypothetical protein
VIPADLSQINEAGISHAEHNMTGFNRDSDQMPDDDLLETTAVETGSEQPPAELRSLIEESARAGERILQRQGADRIAQFNASCGLTVYRILHTIKQKNLSPGDRFCEWGSGLGTITMCASSLDFDACGIEIETELVERARSLARRYGWKTPFHCADIFAQAETTNETIAPPPPVDYASLDVVFAYPWPFEVARIKSLFDRTCTRPGAILVLHHGGIQFEVLRRRDGRRPGQV